LEILCPSTNESKEQISRCHPNLLDLLRQAFKFALKRGTSDLRLADALALAKRMVLVFESFEQEGSMCKAMASVTILQLTMRDVIGADQLYLQEHLNNKQYIQSRECQIVDKLLVAFKNHDIDALDEAQRGQGLFCLDIEVQNLVKNLSLFSIGAKEAREFKENEEVSRGLQELMAGAAISPSPVSFKPVQSANLEAIGHEDDVRPPEPPSVQNTTVAVATNDFEEDDEDEIDLS